MVDCRSVSSVDVKGIAEQAEGDSGVGSSWGREPVVRDVEGIRGVSRGRGIGSVGDVGVDRTGDRNGRGDSGHFGLILVKNLEELRVERARASLSEGWVCLSGARRPGYILSRVVPTNAPNITRPTKVALQPLQRL